MRAVGVTPYSESVFLVPVSVDGRIDHPLPISRGPIRIGRGWGIRIRYRSKGAEARSFSRTTSCVS